MAAFLYHMKSCILSSIVESEARMNMMIEQRVQTIHKFLDAFDLRVLTQLAAASDLSSIRVELDSLLVDLDSIQVAPIDEIKPAPTAVVVIQYLDASFSEDIEEDEPTRAQHKRNQSIHTFESTDDARTRKMEHMQHEHTMRASIINEKLRQQRVLRCSWYIELYSLS